MTTPAHDRTPGTSGDGGQSIPAGNPTDVDTSLRDLALAAAHAGSHAILSELRNGELSVETKEHPADFVTTADKAAEIAILRLVAAARPRDAILAEESGVHPGDSGVRWLVDPLDGTMNFVHHRRDYAVSVGVERDGRIVAGAVVRPADGDWAAGGGDAAMGRDGRPRVSDTADLSDALVGIGLPSPLDQRLQVHAFVAELIRHSRDYRRSGSSACELLSVAVGAQEGYLGFGVNLWDVAAGIALVEAAGGTVQWVTTETGLEVLVAGTPLVTQALVGMVKVI